LTFVGVQTDTRYSSPIARRAELASGVHTIALRTIERWYAAAGGAPRTGRTGSVTATQRFGSDDRLSFRRVVPHTEDIERLVVRIAEACEAWPVRQGFGAEDEGDADDDDDTQAVIQQASLLGQAALDERAGKRARRVQVLGGKELALPPRCANFAVYSLHAGVGFKATDRAGLERLCRYILRPPLGKGPSGKNVQHRGRPRAAAARREGGGSMPVGM
jgi:hypothetical protein